MRSGRFNFSVYLHLFYIALVIIFTVQLLHTPNNSQAKPQVLAAVNQTHESSSLLNNSESEVFNLVNQKRTEHGLPRLKVNPYLVNIAKLRAEDMVKSGYYSHESPNGRFYYDLLSNEYRKVYSCENLELEFSVDSKLFVDKWLASQKHRDCLLSPKLSDTSYAIREMKLDGLSAVSKAYVLVAINSAAPK